MDSAPIIPTTSTNQLEQQGDSQTQSLNEQLNSVITLPQNPSFSRGDRLGAGISDSDYDVGYHQLPVDNQVVVAMHFESPELPVDNIPNKFSVHDSTLALKQINGKQVYPMRAPDINEGF
jgi:hypothetical protein